MLKPIASTDRRDPPAAAPPVQSNRGRRLVFRDVLVLQLKLFVSGWLHFLLGPATLVAALMDLIWKATGSDSRFYRVLDWGHRTESALGLFDALEGRAVAVEPPDAAPTSS